MKISERVEKTLKMIEEKELNIQQLLNLYNNTQKYEYITEEEREMVIAALEPKIKATSTRQARSLFGAKDAQGRALIEEAYAQIASRFDLTDNQLRNGVKVGGDQIAGRKYVDAYLSYKTAEKWNLSLGYNQDTVESLPYLRVRLYQHNDSNESGRVHQIYDVSEVDAAIEQFCELLNQIKGA